MDRAEAALDYAFYFFDLFALVMFDVCRLIEAGCLGSVRGHALNGVCGQVEAVDGLGPGANSLNGGRGKNDRVVGHCFVNVADQVGLVVFFEAGLVFGDLDGGGRGQRVNGGNVRVAALAGWARFWNGVRLVFVFFHVNGLFYAGTMCGMMLSELSGRSATAKIGRAHV